MCPASPARRRFIGIVAASSTLTSLPWIARQALANPAPVTRWSGIALGADAQLHIHHSDPVFAQTLIDTALTEVRRLERIFSLYHTDSVLTRLNRDGHLEQAPGDLLRLLHESHGLSQLTQGAFDPTVQPLWDLYAAATDPLNPATPPLPAQAQLACALEKVDYRAIQIHGTAVSLARPGMALTLNGIAQGYITDRITELLARAGLNHALVDMGEIRGLGSAPGGRPWRVGLPDGAPDRATLRTLDISNQAVSTSSGSGTPLRADGSATHLFNPATGQAVPLYRSVSVLAGNATIADALSTAFSWMDEAAIAQVLSTDASLQVWVLRPGATTLTKIQAAT